MLHYIGTEAANHSAPERSASEAYCHYFDATPLPLLVVDSYGLIVDANPLVDALFGYARTELVGSSMSRLIPERYGNDAWRRLASRGVMRAQALGEREELHVRCRDGREVPVDIGLSELPATNAENEGHSLLAIVDISARKVIEARMAAAEADLERRTLELERESRQRHQVEHDLERSHEDFRYLFLHNPLPMLIYDPRSLCFLEVNDAAVQRYGYSREEFLAMGTIDLHPVDSAVKAEAVMSDARQRDFVVLRNWKHRVKSGETIEVDTYSRALGGLETSIRLVAIVDVTERNAAEAKLRQAQKMEAIGQLTGGVAHDFNNLLSIILGNLELIFEACGEDTNVRAMASDALSSVQRGASLTRRLLAFSRQQSLEPRIVDTATMVQDMSGLFSRSLGETIRIEPHIAEDLWNTRVDASQLENALLNLAVNARDAMPGGGELTIEGHNAVLDEEYARNNPEVAPGEYVQLSVSDSGTGMPKEVMEHVLEPFFTTKSVGRGSGLGLSMVYGFTRQSGGHLKIYSEVGVGTTVKLFLPRATGEQEPQMVLAAEGSMPRAERNEVILLVEDDANIRKLVERLLGMLGYQVLAAEDGLQGLELMTATPHVDLLFTDVVLPNGLSGAGLAAEARRRHPELRVLYMSGYTRNALLHGSIQDETAHMLSKPFRKNELAQAVRRALAS